MSVDSALAALNNPTRRQILEWLKDRSNFPAALHEHRDLDGVCVAYIKEKAKLSQSTVSNYMGILKKEGFVTSERHGQWTFYRRNEEAIETFFAAFQNELLNM